MSEVQSREYKTLLQLTKFNDRKAGVTAFWKHVTTKGQAEGVTSQGEMKEADHRLVWYRDTETFELRNANGFSFRERWKLDNDEPKDDKKVSVKFRSDTIKNAADKSLVAQQGKDRTDKLEEDVVLKLDAAVSKISPEHGPFDVDDAFLQQWIGPKQRTSRVAYPSTRPQV